MGILIGLALIVLVVYVLPIFVSAKIFKTTKIQALGIVSVAYTVIGIAMTIISLLMTSGMAPIMGTYVGVAIVNIIIAIISWCQVRKNND